MKLKKIKEQEKIQKPSKNRNKIKSNRGVTIVALVITIIVMLILAGTTINLTMRGDGIFSEAIEAREKQQISQYQEKIELARGNVALENLGEVTLDNLIEQIYKEKIVPQNAITKLDEEKAKMLTKEGYTFIITAKKAEYAGKGEAVETPPDLQEGDVVFSLDPDTWTNGSVKVSVEANIKDEFTLQYSLDAANWIDYTGAIEITENRTIYASIRNAIGEQGNYASSTINIIDKIDPQDFTPSIASTTNSIIVDASNAKDGEATSKYGESGIKEIWYSRDAGTTWKTHEEDKTNTKYTFEELIQGKEYEVQVKVIDNAGNQIITKAQKITTTTIAGLTITVEDADTWTNGTKTVTITAANSNYKTIRYTTDGSMPTTSSTEYTKEFTVDKNCTITAVAFDSANQAGISAINTVTKIDTLDPTGNISVSTTTNSAKVTVIAQDQAATSISGNSGIKGYYYSKDGGSSYTDITTNTTYEFTNLEQSKEYSIRVKVVDNANNETVLSPTGTVGTTTVAGLTVTVGNADTWTNGTKTITITAANSNYSTIRYTTDGSVPTTSSTEYKGAFTVSSNCTITAVAFDSTNQVGATASNTVTKIDKLAPTGNIEVSTTTNSAKVTVTAQDQEATSTNGISGISGIKGYYYSKDGGSTYTSITTATSHTFSNLAQSSTYNIRVKVVDNANNETILSPTGTVGTATVAGLTVSVGNADTWTNGTKTITITAANINYSTIRYTTNGTTPTTSSTAYSGAFTVSSNCTITAVAFDSTNQVGFAASNTVTKIDKLAPATGTATGGVSVTTTTNSATVTVSATDQAKTSTNGCSGIKGYYYSKDGGSSYTSITTATSYTFSNLAQSSTYNIRVKVVDNANNETILTPTGTVGTGTVSRLTVSVGDADTWTNGTKTITITAANSNYNTIRYTLDGTTPTTSSTVYTKAFTVDKNCTITALAFDSTNQAGLSATNTVTKIDKLEPTGSIEATTTTNSAKVTVTAADQAETSTSGNSGIKGYYYSKDGGSSYTDITTNTSYTFIKLAQGTTYDIKVKVEDNAGNQTVLSPTETVSTGTVTTATGNVTIGSLTWNSSTHTANVILSKGATVSSSFVIQYQVNAVLDTGWTMGTKIADLELNDIVYARLWDGNNGGSYTSLKITDSFAPSEATLTAGTLTTSRSVILTASGTDNQSGIGSYEIYVNGTKVSSTNTYTITNMTFNTSYSCYTIVKDKAGNSKTSSTITVSNTQYVATTADLVNLRTAVNNGNNFSGKTITQTANINMSSLQWSVGIGKTLELGFAGTYEGNNKQIQNLTLVTSNEIEPGMGALFSYTTSTSTIRNLTFATPNINGQHIACIGAVCGQNNGNITNIIVQGGIIKGQNTLGGIVGWHRSGTISLCKNSAEISYYDNEGTTWDGYRIGGISGSVGSETTAATISQCINTGKITGSHATGGITGETGGNASGSLIEFCANKGDIRVLAMDDNVGAGAGGIVGMHAYYPGKCTISNCYNIGNISGYGTSGYRFTQIGGICGAVCGEGGTGIIINSYSAGQLTTSYGTVAGVSVFVYNGTATLTNNYWISGCGATVGICEDRQGVITAESAIEYEYNTMSQAMKLISLLGGNYTSASNVVSVNEYPILSWEK